MNPITDFARLDLTKTYSYADYLSWQFPEVGPKYVEIVGGQVLPQLPGLALEWAAVFAGQ